ncbi:MAG: cyclase family protein [Desulfobacterales bacterium]|nr:cyclase family protein [Desulfobacterales bacterium]
MTTIFLSHALDDSTPLYGGASDIHIISQKSMAAGDSCNTSMLTLPGHAGSHVDAPRHFIPDGKPVDAISAGEWVFDFPLVIDVPVQPGRLIGVDDLPRSPRMDRSVDLLLIRTGFEAFRGEENYWKEGPGISADVANHLLRRFEKLRAVGMDFISISCVKHADEGRAAHKAFLEKGWLLFEDMALDELEPGRRPEKVIALPLRFTGADGAPCTIIASIAEPGR